MISGVVRSLSEGGFGLETTAQAEQGDPIRVRFAAQGPLPEVEVEAIVWYVRTASRGGKGVRKGELRLVGCIVPGEDASFLEIFSALDRRNGPAERPRRGRPRGPARERREEPAPKPTVEEDLPRSRDPLPPPKPEPEETLPVFTVRLRQVGGSRTRTVTVRAHSTVEAAERSRSQVGSGADGVEWAVLEVRPRVAEDTGRRG